MEPVRRFVNRTAKKYYTSYLMSFLLVCVITVISVFTTYQTREIIDEGILSGDLSKLVQKVIIMTSLFISLQITIALKDFITQRISLSYLKDLRLNTVDNVIDEDFLDSREMNVSESQTRIMQETPIVVRFIVKSTLELFSVVLTTLTLIFIMFKINVLLALFSLSVLLLIGIVMFLFSKRIRLLQNLSMKKNVDVGVSVHEILRNIALIKSSRIKQFSIGRLNDSVDSQIRTEKKILKVSINMNFIISFINYLPNTLLLLYGGYLVIDGVITLGSIILMMSYLQQLIRTTQGMSGLYISYQRFLVAYRRYQNGITLDPSKVTEKKNLPDGDFESLKVRDVGFSYTKGHKTVDGVDFELKKGDSCVISGANGTGKTTLVNIINGLIKPDQGVVEINNHNVSDINDKWMMNNVGVVLQECLLYSCTVRENIVLKQVISDSMILNMGRMLGIKKVNKNFLDKQVLNGGVNLSGGERQLVSLLRVLVRKPSLLILDEPMMSFDKETCTKLLEYLSKSRNDFCTIIISHKLPQEFEASFEIVL